jgi:hypothetical protein
LADVADSYRESVSIRLDKRIVREYLGYRIQTIQKLVGRNPDKSRSVLKQGVNVYSAETFRPQRVMKKHLAVVAVETVQSVLGTKPDEPVVILHNIGDSRLR